MHLFIPPSSLLPLQFVDLFLLVVLFVLHLSQDLQQPLHFGLGLPGVVFVPGHLPLQAGDAVGELGTGLGVCCCALGLEQNFMIKINKK